MAARAVFYQECPVCGRSLRIAVQLFGRKVECVHCRGEFVAIDPAARPTEAGSQSAMLRQACDRPHFDLSTMPTVES